MHEVSLMESVVALVEDERRKGGFSRVRVIRLELGALGHAEPDALRFCFDAVVRGSLAEGASLEINMVAGVGWCEPCGCDGAMSDRFSACTVCGGSMRVTAGGDLRLAELEVE